MKIESFSIEETRNFAINMAQNSNVGQIYCLTGEVGAGKTYFTKGFAVGLGIEEEITSPTFNIVNEYYTGKINFFHFDVYRISNLDELFFIGFDEYLNKGAICLIEWAELIKEAIPKSAIWVNITKDIQKGDNYRLIEVINNEATSN